MRKIIIGIIIMAVSTLMVPASTLAVTTLYVPTNYPTIQAAINAASYGDTVQVAAGTYVENITLKSGVIVQGAGAELTTIHNGVVGWSVVYAYGGVSNAKIMGFTITGGNGYRGGGVSVSSGSSITIANNIITGNQATGDWGAGILVYEAFAIITGNIIFQNSSKYDGGGITIYNATATITNNTIVDNRAIVDNRVGGIYCYNSSPTITNSIIWGNGDDLSAGCSATYSNIEDGDLGTGNISAPPMFVDPANGDYHLQSGSPCIDAGSNGGVPSWLTTDFEGDPRILPVNGTVDMGADEVLDSEGPLTMNLVATPNPVPMGATYTITATVDDTSKGGSNILSAECSLDGGTTWDHPMFPADGSFNSPTENVYETSTAVSPAVLEVCARGTDEANNTGEKECIFLVIYDPNGGFVSGGGWFVSPAGAYTDDPLLIGKANFGFVSKYKKGAEVPTGQTEFQFQVANMDFHSSSYEWLVVTGKNYARFKGQGTINGEGEYKFMLWAGDDDPDTFRIKIWLEDEFEAVGDVIYDNGFDQEISGGSIVIHTK